MMHAALAVLRVTRSEPWLIARRSRSDPEARRLVSPRAVETLGSRGTAARGAPLRDAGCRRREPCASSRSSGSGRRHLRRRCPTVMTSSPGRERDGSSRRGLSLIRPLATTVFRDERPVSPPQVPRRRTLRGRGRRARAGSNGQGSNPTQWGPPEVVRPSMHDFWPLSHDDERGRSRVEAREPVMHRWCRRHRRPRGRHGH